MILPGVFEKLITEIDRLHFLEGRGDGQSVDESDDLIAAEYALLARASLDSAKAFATLALYAQRMAIAAKIYHPPPDKNTIP